ncbi:MAG: hypothetical protein CL593_12005 [Alteromonas sp.]|jgi:hypothetical protein|nr:hypothetical protein [Alteromonas sp.]|tara:strand:- start:110 stop:289 length:180 start_codon:yes stop_codon:yes gene_type:complete
MIALLQRAISPAELTAGQNPFSICLSPLAQQHPVIAFKATFPSEWAQPQPFINQDIDYI